jgi:hypothetical protein
LADTHDERQRISEEAIPDVAQETPEDVRALSEIAASDGQPVQFEDGFTPRTIMGALFVTFVMLPGGLYLALVAGQGLGPAAEWVTIILFSEIARRSFAPLKRQEIYLIYLMAAQLTGMGGNGLAGGPFGGFIWNAYFAGSAPAKAFGLAKDIPHWVVPPENSPAIQNRTFLDPAWALPIGLMVIGSVLGWMNSFGLGYILFRITSDVERLPFPMAPVAAGGATALAEAGSKEESWRWRVFSIGAMVGIIFGFFYLTVPVFTGVVLLAPVQLIPIPFLDLAQNTEHFLPGASIGIDFNLANVLAGFVIPYPVVVGGAIATILSQFLVAPILQTHGYFPQWHPGMTSIYTSTVTSLDFWMSLGIGTSVAIGVIGIASTIKSVSESRRQAASRNRDVERRGLGEPPPGRGDVPIALAVGLWFVSTCGYVAITHWLVPNFPLWIILGFSFLYSPLVSYVSARLIGLTTRGIAFPMIKEATIIKSGYKGLDIWYADLGMRDYGGYAQWLREVELTGTKITSLIKMQLFMIPLVLVSSFIFWAFFWHTNVIPSAQFPYVQQYWPRDATMQAVWQTANRGANSPFMQAIKPNVIYAGGALAFLLYGATVALKIPVLYYYGFVGGIGGMPTGSFGQLFGALMGRYYFSKRLGAENWNKYTPVLLAGFSCGMGLVGLAGIALALIVKVTNFLPF